MSCDVEDLSNIPSTSAGPITGNDFDSDDSFVDMSYLPGLHSSSSSSSHSLPQKSNTCAGNLDGERRGSYPANPVLVCNPAKQFSRKMKQERKLKRSTGQQYVNISGKVVRQRKMQILGRCRLNCRERVPEDVRRVLFNEYWSLADHSVQISYIGNLIDSAPTKTTKRRHDVPPEKRKARNYTNTFFLKISGQRVKVCRSCFMKTYDVSQMFVTNVISKTKLSVSSVPQPDRRGRAPGNKHSDETIASVVQHILSFPSYESHYTRRTNKKKYLPCHLNLQKMYSLYCEGNSKPVSRKIYSREFHKLNLSFKVPQVDTCHKCDTLNMKIKSETVVEQKEIYEKELKEHHNLADAAYNTKKDDKNRAKEHSALRAFAFDLQQCLPTPYLNTSVAFYKRQLWTYNLTMHDLGNGDVKCYMWHEAEGGRGANQIATALYEELMNLPDEVKHVILYSDTCGGQNKNSHVSVMFLAVMQRKATLQVIDHKFMVSGHSHMECDVDHGLIEKKKKKSEYPISHPYDWFQLVRTVGKKKTFIVNEMTHDKFLDFASLLKNQLVLRKKNSEGNLFKWQEVKWLRYTQAPGKVYYKTSLQENEPFKIVSFLRRGKPNPKLDPKSLYTDTLQISKEKKEDLLSLLPLIRPEFHQFYRDLKVSNSVVDSLPDIEIHEEADDFFET